MEHNSVETGDTQQTTVWVHRHSKIVRICHWINAVAFVGLCYTGMQILLDYPALFWGKAGYMGHSSEVHLSELGLDLTYNTYGSYTLNILGLEFPGDREWGRYNHFFYAWLFALNGIVYVVCNLVNRHFKNRMVPEKKELTLQHLLSEIWGHMLFRKPKGEEARKYNTLQKITYLIVIFILCPLIVLTGLAQSPGFVSAFPIVHEIFDGRQTARTLHVISMALLIFFMLVHVFQVFVAGFINEMRSMITGRFVLPKEEDQ